MVRKLHTKSPSSKELSDTCCRIAKEHDSTVEFCFAKQIFMQNSLVAVNAVRSNEIFEKNLLILLPYYIINYEKELSKIASDTEKTEQLVTEYDRIIRTLSDVTYDDDTSLFHDILQMMRRVMNYL